MTRHWIEQAEQAFTGAPSDEVTLIDIHKPKLFDGEGIRAVTAPFFAAFMWAAGFLREEMAGSSMDLIALVLRFLALALTVRTILAIRQLAARLSLRINAPKYKLALTEEGLLYRTPKGDVAVPKADVVAIKEPGGLGDRGGDFRPVYVVTQPDTGRTHVPIAPVLDRTPRALAERLMRWLGPIAAQEGFELPAQTELPSKVYDDAAKGEITPGHVALKHGSAWFRGGPYASLIFGLAIADSYVRMPAQSKELLGPVLPTILVIVFLLVPILWVIAVGVDIGPRKGLSMLLTPGEAIMRTRKGVHVIPWTDLKRASASARRSWSLIRGAHESRGLLIERHEEDSIDYVETFLGAPAEVVVGLCEGLKKGIIRDRTVR